MSDKHTKKPPRQNLATLAIELAKSPLGASLRDQAAVPTDRKDRAPRWAELVCDYAEALYAELRKRADAQAEKGTPA
jgi:hypothetical protein